MLSLGLKSTQMGMMSCRQLQWLAFSEGIFLMTLYKLVGDILSLKLRGSLTTAQPLSLWAKEWEEGWGKRVGKRRSLSVSSYWVLGPMVNIFTYIISFNAYNNLKGNNYFSYLTNRHSKAQCSFNLPKFTQQIRSRVTILPYIYLTLKYKVVFFSPTKP